MGVRGLSTFVDHNQQLLTEHRLHGTKVVIDGNNLYHFLFYSYNVSHQFGGDYDHYARKIKHFFNTLRLCNVTPYVVFDGGYDPDDRKLPTILKRMSDRRETVHLLCSTGRGKVLPILARETFRQVLDELDIAHVSCDFEADDQIVVLANDFGCPVMSNDSDFYVYSLDGGYIPFDYINHTLCVFDTETEEKSVLTPKTILKDTAYVYIPVKYYHYTRFNESFETKDTSVMPLIATLLGNDFVDGAVFEHFFAKLSVPKNACKNFVVPSNQSKMFVLLHWLESLSDVNRCVKKVVETTPVKHRDKIRTLMSNSIASYSGELEYTSLNLRQYFDSGDSANIDRILELADYYDKQLPKWFVSGLRNSQMSTFLQNAAVLHRVILLCQVEVLPELSTYRFSEDIRQVMYGIIVKPVSPSAASGREGCIVEYDREVKNTKKFYMEPESELEGFGQLPSLETMPETGNDERKHILINTLGVGLNDLEQERMSFDLMVLLCVVVYWVRNCSVRTSLNHVRSLLLCVIMLQVKTLTWLEQKRECQQSVVETYLYQEIVQAYKTSTKKQLEHIEKRLKKYFWKPEHSSKCLRENMIVHSFSQFQACLLDTVHLNQLLIHPVPPPNLSVIFNGTFVYNLCRDLLARVEPNLFVTELLLKDSPLHQMWIQMESFVLRLCSERCFMDSQKTSKKKTKKKLKKGSEKSRTLSSPSDIEGSERNNEASISVNCSVNNRFALLDISD